MRFALLVTDKRFKNIVKISKKTRYQQPPFCEDKAAGATALLCAALLGLR